MRTNIKNSKKIIFPVLFAGIFLFSIVLTACGQKGPSGNGVPDAELFGTWNQITEDGSLSLEDLGIPSGYIFEENGKGTDLFWDVTFQYVTEEGILYIDYDDVSCDDTSYSYEIQGDKVTLTRMAKDALPMVYQKEKEESKETESQ